MYFHGGIAGEELCVLVTHMRLHSSSPAPLETGCEGDLLATDPDEGNADRPAAEELTLCRLTVHDVVTRARAVVVQ